MEQTIKITLPDDPTAPALVEFSPGPLAREAIRLSEIPGSGWKRVPADDAELDKFLVDRKLVTPKPRRRGRPDASSRMSAYNKAKKAKPQPAPKPIKVKHDPALGWDELDEAIERKQNQRIGANLPDPTPVEESVNDPWGGFVF